jgi:hypothetical protein
MKTFRRHEAGFLFWSSMIVGSVTASFVAVVIWRSFFTPPIDEEDVHKTVIATSTKRGDAARPAAPRNDFVGSPVCAECHSGIAAAYDGHPMAHSFGEVSSFPVIEDYTDHHSFAPDGHYLYSIEKTTAGVFHHERRSDDSGQTLYDQSVQVDYVMGSGEQGRSYLIDRGGLLFLSPITWYSHAARWDLSPQYKLPNHRRFERRIVDDCLNCHTGRVNPVQGAENRLGSPPFFELAIGCERCHGAGGEHSRLHRLGTVARAIDPIVNPARLDPGCREDICAQCHLQGEGRYPRSGCEVGDFRPGQRLEETCIIFVAGMRTAPEGTARAVSQVEQMRASQCFQASNGAFGCISCHDPHSRPQPSDRAAFYRQKCAKCHADRGCRLPEADRLARQPEDSCIACHMPKLGTSDVPHTSQTDHRVLRQPALDATSTGPSGPPGFYDNAEQRLPRLAIDYARALWLAEHAEKMSNREMAMRASLLLALVEKQWPTDMRILDAQGTASAGQGRFDDAFGYWKKSLSIDPDREQTLETVAILLLNQGRNREARPYLERILQLNPWKANLWGRYARMLGQAREWKPAIVAARRAEELDPSISQIYQFLADAYLQVGDQQQSRHWREKFELIRNSRK